MIRNLEKPIQFNKDISVKSGESCLSFSGPKGNLELPVLSPYLKVEINDSSLHLTTSESLISMSNKDRALIGTIRALIKNCLKGVLEAHKKTVLFTGTGVSVQIAQNQLNMKIGKSHIVVKDIPNHISCTTKASDIKTVSLTIEGSDKAVVGQFARELCDLSKNKYKGGVHIWIVGKEPKLKEGKKK